MRKFWVTMIALVGGIALGFAGKLTGDYATIAAFCVGAFSAANAFEHKVKQATPASDSPVS